MQNENTKLPNYRIYDRTGGGANHDIYAETLDQAIEEGREWIEDGDWSGDEQGGTYRTISLECCVREIVRYDASEDDGCAGEINEDATAAGQSWDCSGSYTPTLPDCPEGGECDLVSVTEMGKEFGSWSLGGTLMMHREVCRKCGQYHVTRDPGCQRNSDESLLTVTIEPADDRSQKWIAA